MNTTDPTTTTTLAGWGTLAECGIPQRVFGELVKLAIPHVQHYHSDLYHDAGWLARWLTGPSVFYFGADATGTTIGTDRVLAHVARTNVWRCELTADGTADELASTPVRGYWSLTVTPDAA